MRAAEVTVEGPDAVTTTYSTAGGGGWPELPPKRGRPVLRTAGEWPPEPEMGDVGDLATPRDDPQGAVAVKTAGGWRPARDVSVSTETDAGGRTVRVDIEIGSVGWWDWLGAEAHEAAPPSVHPAERGEDGTWECPACGCASADRGLLEEVPCASSR